jgi:hypothetical protein
MRNSHVYVHWRALELRLVVRWQDALRVGRELGQGKTHELAGLDYRVDRVTRHVRAARPVGHVKLRTWDGIVLAWTVALAGYERVNGSRTFVNRLSLVVRVLHDRFAYFAGGGSNVARGRRVGALRTGVNAKHERRQQRRTSTIEWRMRTAPSLTDEALVICEGVFFDSMRVRMPRLMAGQGAAGTFSPPTLTLP